jgi:hypothetical protein
VLTDGSSLVVRMGSPPLAQASLLGGTGRFADDARRVGALCSAWAARFGVGIARRLVLRLTSRQRGRRGGGVIVYAALLFEGSSARQVAP